MDEQEPGEIPLEVRNAEIKNLIMEQLGWSDEEWTEEYMLAVSNFGFEINQTDGSPSIPEAIIPEEIAEAAYNQIYQEYIVAETGEDPLDVFPKATTLPVNQTLLVLEEKGRELSNETLLLSTSERRKIAIEKNRKELESRKESGELDRTDLDLQYLLRLEQIKQPLARIDLEGKSVKRALVITQKELEELGPVEVSLANGENIIIDPKDTGYGPEDQLIIFPEDLGGIITSEKKEAEPIEQTLRNIAAELGFKETEELKDIEKKAIEASKILDTPEAIENFNNLLAQIHLLGQGIIKKGKLPALEYNLANVGSMITSAITLLESHQFEDCKEEFNGRIFYDLDQIPDQYPDSRKKIEEIISKLENIFQKIKTRS